MYVCICDMCSAGVAPSTFILRDIGFTWILLHFFDTHPQGSLENLEYLAHLKVSTMFHQSGKKTERGKRPTKQKLHSGKLMAGTWKSSVWKGKSSSIHLHSWVPCQFSSVYLKKYRLLTTKHTSWVPYFWGEADSFVGPVLNANGIRADRPPTAARRSCFVMVQNPQTSANIICFIYGRFQK